MFSGPSNFVESVDTAFWVVTAISVFFLVLITVLMIVFVFKYNKKKNRKAVNIHGNVPLEIAWTVIPTILVLVMFWFGWMGYKELTSVPDDAMEVNVTGQMWQWRFNYSTGLQTDTLYVPINSPVKLNLKSVDVNHSFFIPAFRVKKDVIPGRTNVAWFEANTIGSYDIACAEYCGLNHWDMYTKVVVMPKNDFDVWLGTQSEKADQQNNDNDATSSQVNDTTETGN